MRFVLSSVRVLVVFLLLVGKPSGSRIGRQILNSFLSRSLAHVVVLDGSTKSPMGTCSSIYTTWQRLTVDASLRLVSHLYSENLLDQDHYLDWLINSIENSDLDSLPILLLVQKIYQQEFLRHRQRGKRLASAFIAHLHNVSVPKLKITSKF